MIPDVTIALGGTPALELPEAMTPAGRAALVGLRRAAELLEETGWRDHATVAMLLEAARERYELAHRTLHDTACALEDDVEACAKLGDVFDAQIGARFQLQHDLALVGALWLHFRLRVSTWRARVT